MEDVKQDLGPNPISPPVEEAGEPLDVAKLVHTASRLEAHADALVVGVRVDLVAGHAAAEEPRAVEVDPITKGECCVQRIRIASTPSSPESTPRKKAKRAPLPSSSMTGCS